MTGPADPRDVVDAYHRAWTSGDVDGAVARLAEGARCHAPGAEGLGRDDWHGYLAGFVPMLTGAPEHARMTGEDSVALWYFPQTAATHDALACELFTVREGLIVEIRLVFDRLAYQPPDGASS